MMTNSMLKCRYLFLFKYNKVKSATICTNLCAAVVMTGNFTDAIDAGMQKWAMGLH